MSFIFTPDQPAASRLHKRLADRGEPFAHELEVLPATPALDEEAATLIAQLNASVDADEDRQPDEESGQDATNRLSVYGEITDLLVQRGVPRNEIAWIHDARTTAEREALFARMRRGETRVLLGSTARMGVGVNVQERCYAIHHLTTPWRPCDVKQADGRIWRPGNLFPEVWVFRYIAAPSFDGFSWQGLETKGRFEDAYLRGDPSVRVMKDIDEQIISAGEIKALASGDPRIVQKVRLEHELDKLRQQRAGWEGTRRTARYNLIRSEGEIAALRERVDLLQQAIERRSTTPTLALFDTSYDLSGPAQHKGLGKAIRDALIAWGTTQSLSELKRLGRLTAVAGRYRDLPLIVRLELDTAGKVKLPTLFLASEEGERLTDATIFIGDRMAIVERMEQAGNDLEVCLSKLSAEAEHLSSETARVRTTLDAPWEHARTERLMELGLRYLDAALNEDTTRTEAVIAEVLALAESEGLDIEAIIQQGQAIEEQGLDLSQIRVQLPPLPNTSATQEPEASVLALNAADETPRLLVPPSSEPAATISLSIFADPLPIARPTLEVATLDLKEMATEAARKRAELASRKRKLALDAGQVSFLDF